MHKKDADFLEYYEDLCESYGDPLEVLFDMANDPLMEETVRVSAAKECVAYRYPKKRAIDMPQIPGAKGKNKGIVSVHLHPAGVTAL